MSRKNDMIAALQHRQPSTAVPIWELEFHAWDAISGKHMVLGKEFEALTPAEQEKALHSNAEIMLSVAEEMKWSGLTSPGNYWNQAPGELAYYCLPGDTRFRQISILRDLNPDIMLIGSAWAIITAAYDEEYCEALFESPEKIDAFANATLSSGLEMAKRWRDSGADAVFSASDIADNSGPFYNPQQMDRWIYPKMREWANATREMGLHSIFHSDGNLTPYLDGIASTGVDAIQAIDTVAGMNIVATKAQVEGRLCLCGNVDCGLLLTGTPEQVFESTKTLLLACKPGGGFVLGASNAVQPDVPPANYRAMIEAWKQYGSYV